MGQPGPPCSIGLLLNRLDPDERAAAVEAFDTLPSRAAVVDLLRRNGHDVKPFMVGWHRRRDCGCFQ